MRVSLLGQICSEKILYFFYATLLNDVYINNSEMLIFNASLLS